MSRPIMPNGPVDNSDSGSPAGSSTPQPADKKPPSYAKRGKITIVACVPCRKRKTKCDGKRPRCSQCTGRDSDCSYDMTDDQRKLTYLRDRSDKLEQQQTSLEALIQVLQTGEDGDAQHVLSRLRNGEDAQALAAEVQSEKDPGASKRRNTVESPSKFLSPERAVARVQRYERLLELICSCSIAFVQSIIERLRKNEDVFAVLDTMDDASSHPLEALEYDDDHKLKGVHASSEGQPIYAMPGKSQPITYAGQDDDPVEPQEWTQVVDDGELVDHLMELYFTWQHSFFQNFVQELFQKDFNDHKTKYCSAALVNAICACGCFLSRREYLQADCAGEQRYVSGFFDETMSYLNGAATPNIPNTAAMYLVSYVEGYRGNRSNQWILGGRSALMALDLRLHLATPRPKSVAVSDVEDAENEALARSHAFWGCFHVMHCNSLMLERVPIFQNSSILIDLPEIDDDADDVIWKSYELSITRRPGARSTTFRKCAELSQIVNNTQLLFYAPTESLTGSRLVDQYDRYQSWFGELPQMVQIKDDGINAPPPPHVVCLHLYYHSAILLLFRPFLGFKVNGSGIVPREVCRREAVAISNLWALHRRLFGRSGIWQFHVNCLLIASTIHILYLPDSTSSEYFANACNTFHELQSWQGWAHDALEILKKQVVDWEIELSPDLTEVLYRSPNQQPPMRQERHSGRTVPAQSGGRGERPPGPSQQVPLLRTQQYDQPPHTPQYAPPQQSPKRPSGSPLPSQTGPSSQQKRPRVAPAYYTPGRALPTGSQQASPTSSYEHNSRQGLPTRGQPSGLGSSVIFGYPARSGISQGVSPASYLYNPNSAVPQPTLFPTNMPQDSTRPGAMHTSRQLQQQQQQEQRPTSGSRNVAQTHGSTSEATPTEASTTADPALHGGIEGLTFAEDWRNPYLTFMQQPRPPQ